MIAPPPPTRYIYRVERYTCVYTGNTVSTTVPTPAHQNRNVKTQDLKLFFFSFLNETAQDVNLQGKELRIKDLFKRKKKE